MPTVGYGEVGWPVDEAASETSTERRAKGALAPLALCVGAGFVLAFAPVVVWRIKTGDWVCLNDWFTLYYLRFAAQAYYNRVLYISDLVVPGGITGYPWLHVRARHLCSTSARCGPVCGEPHLDPPERNRPQHRLVLGLSASSPTAVGGGRMHDVLSLGLRLRRRAPADNAASNARVGALVPSYGSRCNSLGIAFAVACSRSRALPSLHVLSDPGGGAGA